MNRLIGIARFEQSIRNSRFIAVCGPIAIEEETNDFLAEHGAPGCRHVCHAWRLGQRVRFDDAGEPGGTAGRPILTAIGHFELDRAIVVVSRFFGGIKLGTGGLTRAYGSSAMGVLAQATLEPIVPMQRLRCSVPFGSAGELHALADRSGAVKIDERWFDSGLELELELPIAAIDGFAEELGSLTRGAAQLRHAADEDDRDREWPKVPG